MNNFKNKNVEILKERISGIPTLIIRPTDKSEFAKPFPTIIYYHGWSSSKDNQVFNAYVLASLGYQVMVADAIYHGERGSLNYQTAAREYFIDVLNSNLEEYKILRQAAVNEYDADLSRLAVTGHSMGGYTAAGVFTLNPELKTVVVYNGAFDWYGALKLTATDLTEEDEIRLSEKFKHNDPNNHIDKLIDRPIKIAHGDKDSLVPILPQLNFYNKLREKYSDKSLISMTTVERMDHYISMGMYHEGIYWFNKYLDPSRQ